MAQAPEEVILPRLGHEEQVPGQPLFAHVLRHDLQGGPDGADFSEIVPKDLSASSLQQRLLGELQPLIHGQHTVGGAHLLLEKVRRPQDPVPGPAHGGEDAAPDSLKLFGQLGVGPFQKKGGPPVHRALVRQQQTEPGLKVVVPAHLVIEAQTFGPAADQAHGHQPFHLGELLMKHRCAVFLVERPGKLKPVHRSPWPFR